jgi:hypothetical protein
LALTIDGKRFLRVNQHRRLTPWADWQQAHDFAGKFIVSVGVIIGADHDPLPFHIVSANQ